MVLGDTVQFGMIKELYDLIGHDALMILVENFGGLRIYIPKDISNSKIAKVLPPDVLIKLSRTYCGSFLRVPLARQYRARHYRLAGLNNRKIARKLGMTESGVEHLFRRTRIRRPLKHRNIDPRQIDLFE